MAITHKGTLGSALPSGAGITSLSFSTTRAIAAGDTALFVVAQSGAVDPTLTVGGQSATLLGHVASLADASNRLCVLMLVASAGIGSGSAVSLAWSSSVFNGDTHADLFSSDGPLLFDALSADASGSGFGVPYSSAAATVDGHAGALLWGFVTISFNDAVASPTNGFALSQYTHSGSGTGLATQYRLIGANGSYVSTGTWVGDPGGNTWIAGMLALREDIAATAPVNTVAPAVTGTAITGETLTCTTGTWTGAPTPDYARQWYLDGSPVTGETGSSYLALSTGAVNCVVTASNSQGSASASSNTVTVALPPPPPAQPDAFVKLGSGPFASTSHRKSGGSLYPPVS